MSDTNPHIRHHLQMSHAERVEVVYRDHRRDSDTAGHASRPTAHPTPQPASAAGAQAAAQAASSAQAPIAPETSQMTASSAQPPTAPETPQTTASAPTAPEASQTGCAPQELHVCFNCASELVYPLDWTEEGPRHWRIVLRCPECEARREGVFEQEIVERLDDELDRASGALLSDLKRLTHANMSDEIEFFVRALRADLVLPSDF